MTSSFYFAKKDFERVGIEFQQFNDEYHEITLMFEKEFFYVLQPGIYPSDPTDAKDLSPEKETKTLIGKFKKIEKGTLSNTINYFFKFSMNNFMSTYNSFR